MKTKKSLKSQVNSCLALGDDGVLFKVSYQIVSRLINKENEIDGLRSPEIYFGIYCGISTVSIKK
jgi:hypothetical protein